MGGAIEQLTINEVEQNPRFQGQYFDSETTLHYNNFRYYDRCCGAF
uniref:YD repeat protein n=1 Tax=Pseudomonas putida (strain W619) TaxID=390235 RepID=B1J8W0_PSEPW